MKVSNFFKELRDNKVDMKGLILNMKKNPLYSAKQLRKEIEAMPWALFQLDVMMSIKLANYIDAERRI